MTKKGEAGIGTLILFIALIMVAAIAAAVLIQTSGSLQSKALATGTNSAKKVSSGIQIVDVTYGKSTLYGTEGLATSFKLSPGSEPVNLSNAKLRITTSRWSFTSSQLGVSAGAGIPLCTFPSGGLFLGLRGNTSSFIGILHPGEILTVCVEAFHSGSGILESEEFSIDFISSFSSVTRKFVMPSIYSSTIVNVFP